MVISSHQDRHHQHRHHQEGEEDDHRMLEEE
jgi:hypothetical protein